MGCFCEFTRTAFDIRRVVAAAVAVFRVGVQLPDDCSSPLPNIHNAWLNLIMQCLKATMSLINLLHISDLHLMERRGFHHHLRSVQATQPEWLSPYCDRNILRQCVREAYAIRDRLHAVVITGDLAHSGAEADLKNARRFIFSENSSSALPIHLGPHEIESSFASLQKPIIFLPGNHDRYCWKNKKKLELDVAPSRHFDTIFDWTPSIDYLPNPENPELAIITADFSLNSTDDAFHRIQKQLAALGQGRVYQDRLDSLVQMTEEAKSRSVAVIWAIHFPPEYPHQDIKGSFLELLEVDSQLEKRPQLARTATAAGVKFILCGHRHRLTSYQPYSDTSVTVKCTGTACCVGKDDHTAVNLLGVQVQNGSVAHITEETWTWDASERAWRVPSTSQNAL